MASLEAKQAELQQLQAIETMSSDLVAQLEHVSANFDSLSEGTKGETRWRFAAVTVPYRTFTPQWWPMCWEGGTSC